VNKVGGKYGEAIKIKLRPDNWRTIEPRLAQVFTGETAFYSAGHRPGYGEKSRDKVIRIDALNRESIRRSLLHAG